MNKINLGLIVIILAILSFFVGYVLGSLLTKLPMLTGAIARLII